VSAIHNCHLGPMVVVNDVVNEVIPENLSVLQESAH
jgi:hypothetical protein